MGSTNSQITKDLVHTVFWDFKKPFEKVSHQMLLMKQSNQI